MQREEQQTPYGGVSLTLGRQGPMYLAMCGKTIVFRSLDKANVLHFISRWNNQE